MKQKILIVKTKLVLFVLFVIFTTTNLHTQPKFKINAYSEKAKLKIGETTILHIDVELPYPWHTYPATEQINKDGIGPTPTEFNFVPDNYLITDGKVKYSKLKKKYDNGFEMDASYLDGKFSFFVPIKAQKDIDFKKDDITTLVYMQFCDTQSCIPPDDYKVIIEVDTNKIVTDTATTDVDSAATAAVFIDTTVATIQASTNNEKIATATTESQKEIDAKRKEGFWAFLWFAMGAGALSLLTPCVFPMIPITVSFFTKRSEKAKSNSVKDAFIYAIGIMFTFTGLGVLLAIIFGATGIRDFAANGWINLFITAIFIIFALNLFGAFEIQIPSRLMNKLNTKSNEGNGIISILLMALTFSITSFTCTVPFVGSTLVAASGGDWFQPIVGMIGFSGVFAAPFFLLALFPSVMKKMPKAGGWMNNVKVIMGFIEIAAALKFLSNADLVWNWGVLPKELFLSVWIIICLLIVLYVIGIFRLSHDSEIKGISAVRIIWAIAFGAIGFYLLTGLFGKTLGELDAFLPPAEYRELMNDVNIKTSSTIISQTPINNGLQQETWLDNYESGIKIAKETGKPLFVDFTGFTCTNCRWMEQNMFKREAIYSRMKEFILVRLYTDRRNEPYISNKKLQQEAYGSIELPLYVIISPDGEHIGTKTFTRDMQEFVDFLDKGIALKR